MECERSVITMTLLQLDYLVYGLGNCVDDTSTQTGLIISCWSLQTHACLVKSTGAQPKTTFNFKCVFILELKGTRCAHIISRKTINMLGQYCSIEHLSLGHILRCSPSKSDPKRQGHPSHVHITGRGRQTLENLVAGRAAHHHLYYELVGYNHKDILITTGAYISG